jgi:hypothetical protein
MNELLEDKTFSSISATKEGFLAILVEIIDAALCMYQDSPTAGKDAKVGEKMINMRSVYFCVKFQFWI